MKRRDFIKIASGLSIASLGSYALFPSFENVAKKIINNATNNLNLSDQQIEKFMKEASTEKYWNRFSTPKKAFISIHYFLENGIISIPYYNKYRQYKDVIIGQFLLSTDFFLYQMDENRKINYLAFYNPYKMPCANPFSNNFT